MTDFMDVTRRTPAWIKRAIEEGRLEIKPPYQRNPVWLDPQKSSLIDTILHGYPIPELYLQDLVDSEGNETHFVVDGQQRIRACVEFADGEFELDPNESLPSRECLSRIYPSRIRRSSGATPSWFA